MEKNQILITSGTDYKRMTKELLERTDLKSHIKDRDKKIGIKPNLVSPSEASWGATTHPEVVAGIIEYLKEHGFRNLVMMEGSWVGDKTREAFEVCGYDRLEEEYQVPFWDMQKDKGIPLDCGGMELNICERVKEIDFLINVPVLKGHCQTKITCALKNMKGLIPNKEKRRFHSLGLHNPIAHLNMGIRQDFIVVDNICGDLDFEEGGNPVPTGRMLLGEDPVQLDAYGCRLMGLALEQAPYIQMAEAWGAGSTRLEEGDVVRLNEPSAAADYPAPSGAVAALTRTVQARSACSACYASLVRALHTSGVQGLPIAIGQGWRGIPFDGLGIGACCNYAKERVPGCPPPAEDILRVLSARC